MFSRFSVLYAPEIILEQLEERIVLDGAVGDVSSRVDLFSSQVSDSHTDTEGAGHALDTDALIPDHVDSVPSLAHETGTEWLQDGTWHYWERDWAADGNGHEFHSWQDGSSSFHQIQWDAALNSKGTHNGFDYNLQRAGTWTYQAVQWDASQNGYSYEATSTGMYTYQAEEWSNGMGYSYSSDSNNQWTYHICQTGNEPGDVVEFKSDSAGYYDFKYTWANGQTWHDTNNHLPVAQAFSESGDEDTSIAIDGWSLTDEDIGDTLASVSITTLPSHGTLKVNNLAAIQGYLLAPVEFGSVSFVPDADWHGTTTFGYAVTDSKGGSSVNEASVTIDVVSVNDIPTANPFRVAGAQNAVVSVNGWSITDVEDGTPTVPFSVLLTQLPEHGILEVNGSPVTIGQLISDLSHVTFTPDENWYGITSLGYRAADSNGGVSESVGTVVINVEGASDDFRVLHQFGFSQFSSSASWLTDVNGTLYFVTYNTNGHELWKSDGSIHGTVKVKDVINPSDLTNVDGNLYFWCFDPLAALWTSDGTEQGTYSITSSLGPGIYDLEDVNGTLYFACDNGYQGAELWKSDGTVAGTVMVKNIAAETGNYAGDPYHQIWVPGPPRNSWPRELTDVNGTLYFAADDWVNGVELWRSDGTEAGTVMVKDILSGPNSSTPSSLTNVNGTLFFMADDGTNGPELWKSDGTDTGTTMVKDIHPGANGSALTDFTNVHGTLYFMADNGVNGFELWKSDGTGAGTVMVKDIWPGSSGSAPCYLTSLNGVLYFVADDGANGRELWRSDGTETGTVLVKDIGPGPNSGEPFYFPTSLTNVNGVLYFVADDGVNGRELWKSDGTGVGTVIVKDFWPGWSSSGYPSSGYPQHLAHVNGKLYFTAYDEINGEELIVTPANSIPKANAFTESGNEDTVIAIDGWSMSDVDTGDTLASVIITSLPANGTLKLNDTNVTLNQVISAADFSKVTFVPNTNWYGSTSFSYTATDSQGLMSLDAAAVSLTLSSVNDLPIAQALTVNGHEDTTVSVQGWKMNDVEDGSNVAPVSVALTSLPSHGILKVNGTAGTVSQVIEAANLGNVSFIPDANWNGSTTFGYKVTDSNAGVSTSAANVTITVAKENELPTAQAFFVSTVNDNTVALNSWKSSDVEDGNNIQPFAITINSLPSHGVIQLNGLTVTTSQAIAAADLGNVTFSPDANWHGTTSFGYKAIDSEGGLSSIAATVTIIDANMVRDIAPGDNIPASIGNLIDVNGRLFFTADDRIHGNELWISDGTLEGTYLVKDINLGNSGSSIDRITDVNGILYFIADGGHEAGTGNKTIWKSDGTEAGTVAVAGSFAVFGLPEWLTEMNGKLYFTALPWPEMVRELWVSDGTPTGTFAVTNEDFDRSVGGRPGNLTVHDGALYFTGNAQGKGTELWVSDGTTNGTRLVADINYGGASSNPSEFKGVGKAFYFSADDGVHGRELWQTDGSTSGTSMVDVRAGSLGSSPSQFQEMNGILYFSADDGINGRELWRSDGTRAGTFMVKDIRAGSGSSSPDHFVNKDGMLYFCANDGINGRELWRTDGTSEGTVLVSDFGWDGPYAIVDADDFMFVVNQVSGSQHKYDLWTTDGTSTGNNRIISYTTNYVSNYALVNDTFYFVANDGVHGDEVWRSDGTVAGTRMTVDIDSTNLWGNPSSLISVNNSLYFIANDGIHGSELWVI